MLLESETTAVIQELKLKLQNRFTPLGWKSKSKTFRRVLNHRDFCYLSIQNKLYRPLNSR